jgi:hypothetical protein
MFARPVYYLAALALVADFDAVTREDVTKAYTAMAANGFHPDRGGDPELWKLITAAFNEAKGIYSKKRGKFESSSDRRWMAAWDAMHAPKAEAPKDKPKASKANDGFVFEDIDGESKDDRRKRYARTRQQYRYANDAAFATARREASKKSHSKSAAAKKAEREAAAAAAASA